MKSNEQHPVHSPSADAMSFNNQSNYSSHGNPLHSCVSNLSIEIKPKYLQQANQRQPHMNERFSIYHFSILSKFKPKINNHQMSGTKFSQSTESV
jgi:hypothetical protein